jgi:acetyl-CoA carboxylase biotin carboxyl carrier protein
MAELEVKAEITGKVWQIAANEGDTVAEDDPVVILEAMKMEIPVNAPGAGKIKELLVGEGDSVKEGDTVAILEE